MFADFHGLVLRVFIGCFGFLFGWSVAVLSLEKSTNSHLGCSAYLVSGALRLVLDFCRNTRIDLFGLTDLFRFLAICCFCFDLVFSWLPSSTCHRLKFTKTAENGLSKAKLCADDFV